MEKTQEVLQVPMGGHARQVQDIVQEQVQKEMGHLYLSACHLQQLDNSIRISL